MKNTKLIRILAPVVAIALLIGAIVGINAFAADTPEIVSMNVEYGSELYLYYAVDASTVTGTPKLEVVNEDGSAVIKTVTECVEKTVNGISCYIFRTNGVAPGQLNKSEYVRAVGDNGKGDIVKYSVEEYLYTKLYKEGFAAKTEANGINYNRRNLYFWLLEYGQSAQNLFYPDAADKIGDSTYVAIKGNASATGEYELYDTITLADPAVDGFDYWKVTEMTSFGKVIRERKLAAGYEYTVVNSAVIIPVVDDDDATDVEVYDPSVITFNADSEKFYAVDPGSNVVLERKYDAETAEWFYSVDKKEAGMVKFYIHPTAGAPAEGATKAEITFDLYIPSDAAFYWQFNLVTDTAKNSSSTYLWAPFLYSAKDKLVYGAWNSIRIVYTPKVDFVPDAENNPYDEGAYTASYFINGTFIKTDNKNYSKTRDGAKDANVPMLTDLYAFELAFSNDARGAYKLDNVSFVFK